MPGKMEYVNPNIGANKISWEYGGKLNFFKRDVSKHQNLETFIH